MKLKKQVTVCGAAIFCVAVFSLYLMLDRVQHDPARHQSGGNFPRVSGRGAGGDRAGVVRGSCGSGLRRCGDRAGRAAPGAPGQNTALTAAPASPEPDLGAAEPHRAAGAAAGGEPRDHQPHQGLGAGADGARRRAAPAATPRQRLLGAAPGEPPQLPRRVPAGLPVCPGGQRREPRPAGEGPGRAPQRSVWGERSPAAACCWGCGPS